MMNLVRTAEYLANMLERLGFIILSDRGLNGVPLVAFRLNPERKHHFDEFAVAHQLRERGWVVPAYTMAPNSEKLKLMRVVVREDFSRARCDQLVMDIKFAVDTLASMSPRRLSMHVEHIRKHSLTSRRLSASLTRPVFFDEDHSLQAKSGKTHAVC
ncbi:MAG: hypothetical protein M1819_005908 [Sarea resinae]|nr:MAG: hypothetical protein M1819_005908 [Sarea resinae]